MLKLGKAERIIEVETEELHEEVRSVNTLVVGSLGYGKDFTVTVPQILFEENKNIFVFDPNNELLNNHAYKGLDEYKEKQGYAIWRYDLMEEGLLDKIKHILTTQDSEKHFVHIYFKQEEFTVYDCQYQRLKEHQNKVKERVYQVIREIRLSIDRIAKRGFHLFLMNADNYHTDEISNFSTYCIGFNIGLTMSVSSINSIDKQMINNCWYIIFKAQQHENDANWIVDRFRYHYLNYFGTLTPSPLLPDMLQELPIEMALVCKTFVHRKDRTHQENGWNRLVETYNVTEILKGEG